MAVSYNPASLRVRERSPSTVDWNGVTTLEFPGGSITPLGRGTARITFNPYSIVIGEVPGGTKDGSNPTFTLAFTPVGTIMLWRSMELMYPGVHYNLSGATITYTTGNEPQANDSHVCIYKHS